MELRHFRSLTALVDHGFSVSRAAKHLHLVQPAVSQHIKQLESEIGARLFVRQGKRLTGLTDDGQQILHYARQALSLGDSILAVGRDHAEERSGVLRIATTHTQACYVLPPVIRQFVNTYPDVNLQINQGTPGELVEAAVNDAVDLAICTEALSEHAALEAIPCYRWNRCVIAPPNHPILRKQNLTLDALCEYPLITYVFGFTGRGNFSDTFAHAGVSPNVVLSAADTDVIKTYVREGLGIGIIARLAYQPGRDDDLGMRDLSHLFPWEITKVAYVRSKYLRKFARHFIDIFRAETGGGDADRVIEPCRPRRADEVASE